MSFVTISVHDDSICSVISSTHTANITELLFVCRYDVPAADSYTVYLLL